MRRTTVRIVAEGLAIFVAVTASLYADDWRERRNAAEAERDALELIVADLQADSDQLMGLSRSFDRNANASAWLTEHWEAQHVDPDSAGRIVQSYVYGAFYRPQDAAFSSLVEGGGLDLLQNEGLRKMIIQHYAVDQPQLVDMVALHMAEVRKLLDLIGPHFLLFRGEAAGSVWPPSDAPAEAVTSWEDLAQDSRVYNKAIFVGALAQFGAQLARANIAKADSLRAAVQSEIGI